MASFVFDLPFLIVDLGCGISCRFIHCQSGRVGQLKNWRISWKGG